MTTLIICTDDEFQLKHLCNLEFVKWILWTSNSQNDTSMMIPYTTSIMVYLITVSSELSMIRSLTESSVALIVIIELP